MRTARRRHRSDASAFAGYRFPPEVVLLAVRWYLRYGLSYRDAAELLAERGVDVDHVTIYRWVQRFTPLAIDAARPCRHGVGAHWFVDETYVRVAGRWRYVYRAVDGNGQVIDVYVSARRDTSAARRFFTTMPDSHGRPDEVTTDLAAPLLRKRIALAQPERLVQQVLGRHRVLSLPGLTRRRPQLGEARRDTAAARRFFESILDDHGRPDEVTTDLAAPLLRVVDQLLGGVVHDTGQYANNRIEWDHGGNVGLADHSTRGPGGTVALADRSGSGRTAVRHDRARGRRRRGCGTDALLAIDVSEAGTIHFVVSPTTAKKPDAVRWS